MYIVQIFFLSLSIIVKKNYFTIMHACNMIEIFKRDLYSKRSFSIECKRVRVLRFIIERDCGRALCISSAGNQKPMHQKAGTRVNATCVCRCTYGIARSHRFFFLLHCPRRRISEFHRRPRLPDLRSIPKPKDEAKPQIAQDPRHLICTS